MKKLHNNLNFKNLFLFLIFNLTFTVTMNIIGIHIISILGILFLINLLYLSFSAIFEVLNNYNFFIYSLVISVNFSMILIPDILIGNDFFKKLPNQKVYKNKNIFAKINERYYFTIKDVDIDGKIYQKYNRDIFDNTMPLNYYVKDKCENKYYRLTKVEQ